MGVAVKLTLVPKHIVVADGVTLTLTGRFGLMVIVTPVLVAGLPIAQVAFEVSITLTTSLFARADVENELLFVPAFTPLTCHWYDGLDPPLVGIAVKLASDPAQIVVDPVETVTLAGRFGFTVIVIPALVAGFPAIQATALEVIITVTTSLLARPLVLKMLLLVPAFIPFIFHW